MAQPAFSAQWKMKCKIVHAQCYIVHDGPFVELRVIIPKNFTKPHEEDTKHHEDLFEMILPFSNISTNTIIFE